MVCSESQEEFGREENKKCMLICEGKRHDGVNRQYVSPEATADALKPEERVSHNPSQEERSAENKLQMENTLQVKQHAEDFGKGGYHNPGNSCCEDELCDNSVHRNQREGVAGDTPPWEGALGNVESLPASMKVETKSSRGKAIREAPAYTSQVIIYLHC